MGGNNIENSQAQPRLQIREGMSVDYVRKHGSTGQRLAANLFDENARNADGIRKKDGLFNKDEAERFNNFNFSVKNNVFTMYDREQNQTIEIKYDNIEDLYKLLESEYNTIDALHFHNKGNNSNGYLVEDTKGGKITLDLSTSAVVANGIQGKSFDTNANKVTIKNSDLENIYSNRNTEEFNIKNTKNKGLLFDSPTKFKTDKYAKVNIDSNSKVEIERKD